MAEKHSISKLPPLPVQEGVEFRHVPGWPGYAVGDNGVVLSCRTRNKWKPLRPVLDQSGHFQVTLRQPDGKRINPKVHRLVLEAFAGPRSEKAECRHLDGDPTNNHLCNICWGSHKENSQDRVRLDELSRKLSDDNVQDIRELSKHLFHREIAQLYGVSRSLVSQVLRQRCCGHLTYSN